MVVLFFAACWALFRYSDDVRTVCRWIVHKNSYKERVLTQPAAANGSLKHVEWDGWGFPGAGNTVVYLIFDPNDSLAPAAKVRSPGKFGGIPCQVLNVRRLESHWYTVLFYTETDWEHCS